MLSALQARLQEKTSFTTLADYQQIGSDFLQFAIELNLTRFAATNRANYFFYEYPEQYGQRLTRPLNAELFYTFPQDFSDAFDEMLIFLKALKRERALITDQPGINTYLQNNNLNRVIYTAQQSLGCIGDSLPDSNQSRKRIGQLFETLIRLIFREIGLYCEPRTIHLPIPGFEGYTMPYELDLVFSTASTMLASESHFIYPHEIVGSVKTTSKDRLDKIFLDKHLLSKLIGRDIPVIAIFLHDVQRAKIGSSSFGVNSTFKTNHFLGYTVALNRLDGVYYIDPRPEMLTHERLREQIKNFQQLLVHDVWQFTS